MPMDRRFVAVACLALAAGCRSTYKPEYAPAPTAAVSYDEAMRLREYAQTPAFYANGDVTAGPTEFRYEYDAPAPNSRAFQQRRYVATVADPAIFALNLVLLPYELVVNPPWEKRTYQGEIVEPTYTASVPLPPSADDAATSARPPTPPIVVPRPEASVDAESIMPTTEPATQETGTRGTTAATLPASAASEPPAVGYRGRTAATSPATRPGNP